MLSDANGERRVEVACFNCGDQWTVELGEKERIGPYGRMSNGIVHEPDTVVRNTRGYGTYSSVICDTCGMDGPHDVSPHTPATD